MFVSDTRAGVSCEEFSHNNHVSCETAYINLQRHDVHIPEVHIITDCRSSCAHIDSSLLPDSRLIDLTAPHDKATKPQISF